MSLLELRGAAVEGEEGTLLRPLDLSLEEGERLVVFGEAGSGKAELLRLAAGVLEPCAGTAALSPPRPHPAPVGFAPAEGGLVNNLSLLHNAALPAVYHRLLPPAEAESRARALLGALGLSGQLQRRPALASFPARRLTLLARALLVEPPLFVLEDPLADMDAAAARQVRGVLDRVGRAGESCAVIGTSSLGPYLDWGRRFLLLSRGAARLFESRRDLARTSDPEARMFLDEASPHEFREE